MSARCGFRRCATAPAFGPSLPVVFVRLHPRTLDHTPCLTTPLRRSPNSTRPARLFPTYFIALNSVGLAYLIPLLVRA